MRFDHSGIIGQVKVAGHTVFGPWKPAHDPANNDDIVGPCEEFGMQEPLGYAAAKVGEPFLKIGVGLLVKPEEEKYRFWHNYPVKQFAPWVVTPAADRVTFTQVAALNGTGYEYTKVVALTPGKPAFTIRHTLKNTGTAPITTDVYNHNFFNVDADPVGPNYAVEFPATAAADTPGDRFTDVAKIEAGKLSYTKVLDKGSAHTLVAGLPAADTHAFTLTHAPSNLRLAVTGRGAKLVKLNVWSVAGCVCPEPFVALNVPPGGTQKWEAGYEFVVGGK